MSQFKQRSMAEIEADLKAHGLDVDGLKRLGFDWSANRYRIGGGFIGASYSAPVEVWNALLGQSPTQGMTPAMPEGLTIKRVKSFVKVSRINAQWLLDKASVGTDAMLNSSEELRREAVFYSWIADIAETALKEAETPSDTLSNPQTLPTSDPTNGHSSE